MSVSYFVTLSAKTHVLSWRYSDQESHRSGVGFKNSWYFSLWQVRQRQTWHHDSKALAHLFETSQWRETYRGSFVTVGTCTLPLVLPAYRDFSPIMSACTHTAEKTDGCVHIIPYRSGGNGTTGEWHTSSPRGTFVGWVHCRTAFAKLSSSEEWKEVIIGCIAWTFKDMMVKNWNEGVLRKPDLYVNQADCMVKVRTTCGMYLYKYIFVYFDMYVYMYIYMYVY